jgi:hypothetical protein
MATLNVDEYVAALEAPSMQIGGRLRPGRLLSYPEVARLKQFMDAFGDDPDDPGALARVLRFACDAAYPTPLWQRAFFPWRPSVAEQVLALPVAAQLKVLEDFLGSQAAMMQRTALAGLDALAATRTTSTPRSTPDSAAASS